MFEKPANHSRLIRAESYLTTGYRPAQPVGRATERDRIADAVRPLTHRKLPENLLLFGPAGTGKTTVVKHVLATLTAETRVATAYINCWQYKTRAALLTEVLIQLGYPAPRKGKPVDELLTKLREWLDKHPGALIVLDECDQLDDPTAIIYDLQQTSTDADSCLGLLLISNQPPAHLQLDARSHSRVDYQLLEFHPYAADDLAKILHQRVEKAFPRGSVSQSVITEIARSVADTSGDCREALTLLLRTTRQAERDNASEVRLSHLEQVRSRESN